MNKPIWNKRSDKLVLCLMVKNEATRIAQTTFDSIREFIPTWVVYDTGSTDGTQDIIRKYCTDNDITLYLKEGSFVNFAVSRNILMDYCDEIFADQEKYLLMMDAHDELQNGDKLIDFINNFNGKQHGFHLTQRWWTGNSLDSYKNVRMVKTHKKWRYNKKARVHEYIMTPEIEIERKPDTDIIAAVDGVYLYQNRLADNDSSFKRFTRDKEILFGTYKEDPHEPRTLFYLAQTMACLGLIDESYNFLLKRIKESGFTEEIFHAYLRLGDHARVLEHDWEESQMWYLKAFQHSQRAEPLIKIAEYYTEYNYQGKKTSEFHTAYMYAEIACQLIFPINQILFVDQDAYSYKRWHILGKVAYYVGKYREGKEACIKAIEAKNLDIDKYNLKFYLLKELEIVQKKPLHYPVIGPAGNPMLFAMTVGNQEMRTKDEFNIKHDRANVIKDVINNMIEDERKTGKIITQQHAASLIKCTIPNSNVPCDVDIPLLDNISPVNKESNKQDNSERHKKHKKHRKKH